MKTSPSPSRRSAQWPLVIGSSDLNVAAGMRETRSAETRNVAAFTQYAVLGPHAASSKPAEAGPTVQAMCSTVASSEVACSRSSSETKFGSAAHTAGRKKPVAIPLTAASATISAGSSTNGSATNVPARTRSETIISRRRERRSTSGPSVTPISDDRQEVGDQERGQPATRARAVEDVDRERECREVRSDRRAGRCPEEQREAPVPSERRQSACHSVRHAPTLPPSTGREQWRKRTRRSAVHSGVWLQPDTRSSSPVRQSSVSGGSQELVSE